MNIYQITVYQSESVKYSIEAATEDDARNLVLMGDQPIIDSYIHDFDIIEVEEYI